MLSIQKGRKQLFHKWFYDNKASFMYTINIAKDLFWFTIQITQFIWSFMNLTETHMIM